MSNDLDTALDAEITRRAIELGIETRLPGERSRAARLAARLYAGATAMQRSRIVATLCRPLGPLALVGVASGAFAGLLDRAGAFSSALQRDELAGFTRDQIFELARFVEQASPQALRQVASGIAENPWGVSALGAAAAVLLASAVRDPRQAGETVDPTSPAA